MKKLRWTWPLLLTVALDGISSSSIADEIEVYRLACSDPLCMLLFNADRFMEMDAYVAPYDSNRIYVGYYDPDRTFHIWKRLCGLITYTDAGAPLGSNSVKEPDAITANTNYCEEFAVYHDGNYMNWHTTDMLNVAKILTAWHKRVGGDSLMWWDTEWYQNSILWRFQDSVKFGVAISMNDAFSPPAPKVEFGDGGRIMAAVGSSTNEVRGMIYSYGIDYDDRFLTAQSLGQGGEAMREVLAYFRGAESFYGIGETYNPNKHVDSEIWDGTKYKSPYRMIPSKDPFRGGAIILISSKYHEYDGFVDYPAGSPCNTAGCAWTGLLPFMIIEPGFREMGQQTMKSWSVSLDTHQCTSTCNEEAANYVAQDAWQNDQCDPAKGNCSLADIQNIKVSVIGIFQDTDTAPESRTWLQGIAAAGGGFFFEAPNIDLISQAFMYRPAGVTTYDPVVSNFVVSARKDLCDPLEHKTKSGAQDILYPTVFYPVPAGGIEGRFPHYRGNLKKYDITESYDLETSPDMFTGDVGLATATGGAGKLLLTNNTRKIYSYHQSCGGMAELKNSCFTKRILGMPAKFGTETDMLKNHIYGYDVIPESGSADIDPFNFDGDNNRATRLWRLGDTIHSIPALISYNSGDTDCTNRLEYIAVGANDGMVHLFSGATGEEKWAFIPPVILARLKEMQDNGVSTGGGHDWYADGSITLAHNDTNDNRYIDAGEKALLVFNLRRGGKALYALDISGSDLPSAPVLAWSINNDTTNFSELGQTWSDPAVVAFKGSEMSSKKLFAFFGAGYDTYYDDMTNTVPGGDTGKAIFLIDAETGAFLGKFTYSASGDEQYLLFPFAAPGSIVEPEAMPDFDGLIFYIGDIGGNMWRATATFTSTGTLSSKSLKRVFAGWKPNPSGDETCGDITANPPKPTDLRPVFTAPEITLGYQNTGSLITYNEITMLYFGTGDMTRPNFGTYATDVTAINRFYGIADREGVSVEERNLIDVTADLGQKPFLLGTPGGQCNAGYTTGYGFVIKLKNGAERGEKLIPSPALINRNVAFSTYVPNQITLCGTGNPRSYVIPYMMELPVREGKTIADVSHELASKSLPPEPTWHMDLSGKITILVGPSQADSLQIEFKNSLESLPGTWGELF